MHIPTNLPVFSIQIKQNKIFNKMYLVSMWYIVQFICKVKFLVQNIFTVDSRFYELDGTHIMCS